MVDSIHFPRIGTQPLRQPSSLSTEATPVTQGNPIVLETTRGDQNNVPEAVLTTPIEFDMKTVKIPPLTKEQKKNTEEKQATLTTVRVFLNQLDDLYTPSERLGSQEALHLKITGFLKMLYETDPTITQDPAAIKSILRQIQDLKEEISEAKRLITANENGTLTAEEKERYPKEGTPLDAIKAKIAQKNPNDLIDSLFSGLIAKGTLRPASAVTEKQLFSEVANRTRLLLARMDGLFSLEDQIKDFSDTHLLLQGLSDKFNQFPQGKLKKEDALRAYAYLDEVSAKLDGLPKPSSDLKAEDAQKLTQYKSVLSEDAKRLYKALFNGDPPKAKPPTPKEYFKLGLQQVGSEVRKLDALFSRTEQLAEYKEAYHLSLGLQKLLESPPANELSRDDLAKLLAQLKNIDQKITAAKDESNPTRRDALKSAKDEAKETILTLSKALFGKTPEPKEPSPKENYSEGAGRARSVLGRLDDLLSKTAQFDSKSPDGRMHLDQAHQQISGLLEKLYDNPSRPLSEETLHRVLATVDDLERFLTKTKDIEKERLLGFSENQFKNENDTAWTPAYIGVPEESPWLSGNTNGDFSVLDAVGSLSNSLLGTSPPSPPHLTDTKKLMIAADHTRGFIQNLKSLLSRTDQLGDYQNTYLKMNGLLEELYSPKGKNLSEAKLLQVFEATERFRVRLNWLEAQYQNKTDIAKGKIAFAKKSYAEAKEKFDLAQVQYQEALAANDKEASDRAIEAIRLGGAAMNNAFNTRVAAEADLENADYWRRDLTNSLKTEMDGKIETLSQLFLGKKAPLAKPETAEELYREGSNQARMLLNQIKSLYNTTDRNQTYASSYDKIESLIKKLSDSEGKLSKENLRSLLSLVERVQQQVREINTAQDKVTHDGRNDQFKANFEKSVFSPLEAYFK